MTNCEHNKAQISLIDLESKAIITIETCEKCKTQNVVKAVLIETEIERLEIYREVLILSKQTTENLESANKISETLVRLKTILARNKYIP